MGVVSAAVFLALAAFAAEPRVGAAEPVPAGRVLVDDFEAALSTAAPPEGWKPLDFRSIRRRTEYRVAKEGAQTYLASRSSASASGLFKEVQADLRDTPVLAWRWRVRGSIERADARRKAGDDYAARVYVAFAFEPEKASFWERARYKTARALYGRYPPKTALNYVWDNRLPVGTRLDNAWTSSVKMVVLRSGDDDAGRWVRERRNVLEDYRRAFKAEPPPLDFVAVMTDTDNTGGYAEAAFDDLVFRAEAALGE